MVNLEPIKRKYFRGHAAWLWKSVTGKVKELNTGVEFILELTFYGQYNIYWSAKISLVLHGEGVKITTQGLERDFSQNTRAYTITQSFSFFFFLKIIRSLGNVWQTYGLLKNEHHSEVTFSVQCPNFFIFKQFLTRQNLNINSVLNYLCIQRPIS